MKKAFLIFAVLLLQLPGTLVHAQERDRRERREGEHFRTDHWVFDQRFHHNHYYPAPGYALRALPPGNLVIGFGNRRFFFQAGVWYQPGPAGYVVVRPPVGIVVPVLPPAYTTVWAAGAPYYYANDVYYVQAPGGFMVTAPPMVAGAAPGMVEAPAPQPAPQAPMPPQTPPSTPPAQGPAPQSYYYCESAKAYYPYIAECREGWRQMPAAPPR